MAGDRRFLRSKRLRYALYKAADGKCLLCGCELPENWHGDHAVSWVDCHRTNVHEMMALCPACNLRKGTMSYRKHQAQLIQLFRNIQSGLIKRPRRIGVECICGGGKSVLPIIAAYYAITILKILDKVVWFVPNGTLREQAAEAFLPGNFVAKLLKHNLSVCECDNTANPCKGTNGYVTTPHALLGNPQLHIDYFKRYRCLLVIDEFHHYPIGDAWEKALGVLDEHAVLSLAMTGYLGRADGRRLGLGLRYKADGHIDKSQDDQWRWIEYTLRDALLEQAIIHTHFTHADGPSRWKKSADGKLEEAGKLGQNRDAIFTALNTEYAEHLLEKCYTHWMNYIRHNPRSRMLVVCADTIQARRMLHRLKAMGAEKVAIATYKEGDEADKTISDFRRTDKIQILVTVAKAYEGLDKREITHCAILTHIRAPGWILQNIARAWRYDPEAGAWASQIAFVFLPDDKLMNGCIRSIAEAQEQAARDRNDHSPTKGGNEGGGGEPEDDTRSIIPWDSALTELRASVLGGGQLTPEYTARYYEVISRLGLPISPLQLHEAIRDLGVEINLDPAPQPHSNPDHSAEGIFPPDWPAVPTETFKVPDGILPDKTPGQRIKLLKGHLNDLVHRLSGSDTDRIKAINLELFKRYGPREGMTEAQLLSAISQLGGRCA